MTSTQLFTFVKKSLRITSTAFDDEIEVLIDAAKADISQATDKPFDIDDSVQCNAVAVYAQAYFGYGDEKAETRYQQILQCIGLRKVKYAGQVFEEVVEEPEDEPEDDYEDDYEDDPDEVEG